jgi:hypothetical protein
MGRTQQLLKKRATKTSTFEDDAFVLKAEVRESIFRPAGKKETDSNRLRDVLEQHKVQRQKLLRSGFTVRLQSAFSWIFRPIQVRDSDAELLHSLIHDQLSSRIGHDLC